MPDFLLLFRYPAGSIDHLSADDMQALTNKWQHWAGGLAAQGKLHGPGHRLAPGGKVLKSSGVVTDGPFVEIRECLGGVLQLRADTLDEATTLAHGCPALELGGSVEIRGLLR